MTRFDWSVDRKSLKLAQKFQSFRVTSALEASSRFHRLNLPAVWVEIGVANRILEREVVLSDSLAYKHSIATLGQADLTHVCMHVTNSAKSLHCRMPANSTRSVASSGSCRDDEPPHMSKP